MLHVFDKRPLDFRAIPSHLNYFRVVVQQLEEFWLILSVHSKLRLSHLQSKSATFSQKARHIEATHFHPKAVFRHFRAFRQKWLQWLKMAEFWLENG